MRQDEDAIKSGADLLIGGRAVANPDPEITARANIRHRTHTTVIAVAAVGRGNARPLIRYRIVPRFC